MSILEYSHRLPLNISGYNVESYAAGVHSVDLILQDNNKYCVVYAWECFRSFHKKTFDTRREALMCFYDWTKDLSFRRKQ